MPTLPKLHLQHTCLRLPSHSDRDWGETVIWNLALKYYIRRNSIFAVPKAVISMRQVPVTSDRLASNYDTKSVTLFADSIFMFVVYLS